MVTVVVVVTACTPAASTAPSTSEVEATTSLADAAESDSGPGACNSREAQGLVAKFLAGYNGGATGVAGLTDLFFAPAGRFEWYADQPHRVDEAVFDLASLDEYFTERQSAGDQLTLTEFRFNGYRVIDNTGHFEIALLRGADLSMHGKGAIDCESSKIMALSIGVTPGSTG